MPLRGTRRLFPRALSQRVRERYLPNATVTIERFAEGAEDDLGVPRPSWTAGPTLEV